MASTYQSTKVVRDPSSITVPARFAEPRAEHVAALRQSIARLGQVQPIGITPRKELIWGRRRLAACTALGIGVRVEVWRTDDPAEAEAMSRAENHVREHLTPQQIAAEVTASEEKSSETSANEGGILPHAPVFTRGRGQPKKPRTKAREEVAKKLGVSVDTVERAEKKAAVEAARPPALDALGRPLPESIADEYASLRAKYERADALARQLVQAIGEIESEAVGRASTGAARLKGIVQGVGHELRTDAPATTCVYCKLVPLKRKGCSQCGGTGFHGKGLYDRAEPALQPAGKDAVVYMPRGGSAVLVRVAELDS